MIVKSVNSRTTHLLDWASSFLVRHKHLLGERFASNISKSRASVSPADVNAYFDHLEVTVKDVPVSINVFNYDESDLSDDPGKKKCIFKRGTKYPETIMKLSTTSYLSYQPQ